MQCIATFDVTTMALMFEKKCRAAGFSVRIIPVPGAKKGDYVDFGGLFGAGTVTAPACPCGNEAFVRRGGRIPAPINSLTN